jgi:hypothetical protein
MKEPQEEQEAQNTRRVLCFLCLLWFFPSFLFADGPVLRGRVTDSYGKALADARVRVHDSGGGTVYLRTSGRGAFRIETSGRFYVEIRQQGFRTVRSQWISLAGGSDDDVYQFDVPLQAGNPDETENVILEIQDVEGPEIQDDAPFREALPISDQLFGMRGGINVSNIREGSGQQWLAASGSVFTSSSISASVAETSDFSAALGDTAAVDDSLPAGGTAFHGNLFYFHRNDALNAKNFFDLSDAEIPPFKYHYFGGDLGGEIREGTYLHAEYRGLRYRQSITRAATVPHPILLTGDFSSTGQTIVDPETKIPFPGNRIPASRISPLGLALARSYPAPNVFSALSVSDKPSPNYRAIAELHTAADAVGFRFDHRLTSSDETFVEYQFDRDTRDDPFDLLSGVTNLPFFGVHDALRTQTLRLNNTHIFKPSLIHQFRFSMGYLKQPRTIPGDQNVPLPAILMTDLSNLGHATNLPQERKDRSFEVLNEISWQHSSSETKLGGVVRYLPFHAFLDLYSRGQYQFTPTYSGNALANLLLGIPTNALRLTGDTRRKFRTWTTSLYVQHDWRPLPRVSLNAGLRYDYQTPFREAGNLVANFDEATGLLTTSPPSLYNADRNNFSPRFGIAWRPAADLVARAGYGIFYDTLSVGDSLFLLGLNPPFVRFDVKDNGPVVPQFDLATAFQEGLFMAVPSVFSTSRQLPNPYLQQWSATLELPVRQMLLVSVSYFGQKGTRLRRQLNINQPGAGLPGSLDERRPFSTFKNIFQFETSASSIAHAAEARAERRFQSGFGFSASYRFSRSIDDATLISILPQNSHNLRAERGLSDFHMKHRMVFSGTYTLPGRRYALIKGWQMQAAGSLQSGTPLSAIVANDVSGTGSPIVNRPDLLKDPRISNPTVARFFDVSAFQIPNANTFGNSGRNVIAGPGLRNVDVALVRTLRPSDLTRAQLRADFYNVFNHPNFVAPPTMQNFVDSSDFGALLVARSPRIVQIGLKFLW